jgi:ankyrin repeat protein
VAIETDQVDAIEALAKSGASLYCSNAEMTLLAALIGANRPDLIRPIITSANAGGHDSLVNKADVSSGITPLILAAITGHLDCVHELIAGGADLTLLSYDGKSAMTIGPKRTNTRRWWMH